MGEHPKVQGLVQGGEIAVDFVSAWQMGEGVGQDGSVFRERQEFDGVKGFEQGRAELVGAG